MLDQWRLDAVCGRPLPDILAQQSLLFSNRFAQPLVVASSLALWEVIKDYASPALVAGYSVGELAAHAVAGALTAEDAINLAASRARLMDACLMNSPKQSLLSISGLGRAKIDGWLTRHNLFIAIETGEDSFIVGGLLENVADIEPEIRRSGGHFSRLPVEIASHTPLMRAAVAAFADQLARVCFTEPKVSVLSGISAEVVHSKVQAIPALSQQIAQTIRWADCMDACAEAGITVALELGPGAALSRMLQARHPQIECRSITEFRSIAGVIRWVEQRAST